MKKSILFIVSDMQSGGVSKSMSTLLNVIDYNRFDIDVLILNPSGVFMELLPKNLNIISDDRTKLLFSSFPSNIFQLLKKGYVVSAASRVAVAFFMTFNKGLGSKVLSYGIMNIKKEYDLAVDYNGQHQLYYLVDKVKAKIKVSFFHSDYAKWDYYYQMDQKYYPKIDKIYTISETCVASLKKYFPKEDSKIELFENISSLELIESLAESPIEIMPENAILSIGYLTERKGTLLALESAAKMKELGMSFRWYFIGKDVKDHDYPLLVKKYGLEDYIVFVGVTANPYPYIKNAKIIAHLSYFEGKSIALDEAKLLCKPMVVTNFSTVNDQFTHNFNATITTFDTNKIAEQIIELLRSQSVREKYSQNLKVDAKSNYSEIEKLYNLIEN